MSALTYKKTFNLAYGLLLLYYLQGVAYPSGSVVSQVFILLFLLMGLLAFLKGAQMHGMPGFMKVWTLFCAVQIITFIVSPKYVYGTIFEAIGKVPTYNQMKDIFAYCLSIFIGYNVGKRGFISTKQLAILGLVILGLACVRFVFSAAENMETHGKQITNNAAYNFVTVIPFLPFIFKHYKKIAFASIVIIMSFTMAGAKRGALVCSAIALLFYGTWFYKNHRIGFRRIVLGLIVGCGLIAYGAYNYSQNEYLQKRMAATEKGETSNRDIAYAFLFAHWVDDPNPVTKIFGNGSTQSVTVWGNYAHNDWLEILIDNGLFGVILYAAFFIGVTAYIRKSIYLRKEEKLVCYLILLTWFLKTCFSMGYSGVWNSFSMILLGLMIGNSLLSRRNYLTACR